MDYNSKNKLRLLFKSYFLIFFILLIHILNFKFISVLLLGLLIIFASTKDNEQITKITITTTEDEVEEPVIEEEEKATPSSKNNTNLKKIEEKVEKMDEDEPQKRDNAQSSTEKMIQEARKNARETTTEKSLIFNAPYQDNEDYILFPMGFGTPVNFVPLQIETTSYKTWVSSVLNEENPSIFNYNLKDSKTGKESGDWDTVVDEEGTISGNVIYDKVYLGKYKIDKFKFIEGVEYEDEFSDFKNGKLGLGNCQYADKEDKEYCLLQRLKDNGSIDRRIFSIRELSDAHGELVIGDISSKSQAKDYPLHIVVNEDTYNDIEDDPFKMSWLVKISHILFRNTGENIKKIFDNNIHIKSGLASFDSSCHYIEAPYSYINYFEDQMFDVYYDNVCRKVNRDGTYMFLCDKQRYNEVKDKNKNLALIIVIDGYGYEIPMDTLFEKTSVDDYEFFVHFKDFEQDIWNLGHPFFHQYTIIFDQDNQEIGIDGDMIYSLQDETEASIKSEKNGSLWKVILWIMLGLVLLSGLFLLARKFGIDKRINGGDNPNLVRNESVDDLSFNPGTNVH